jgi:fumarate reductase flavoprotein subunit
MIKIALTAAYGALLRTESRGAHSREDYPERNDRDWLKRTIMQWSKVEDDLPQVSYEKIDINSMELPPGFRGYGKDMTISHPTSNIRQQAVNQAREENSIIGDRFSLQEMLMPYKHLLPPKYRTKNERLDERFSNE